MKLVANSFFLLLLAGLCEIGGGYLVWQWWRNGSTAWCPTVSTCLVPFSASPASP